ncbi:vitamin K epoxide reductase [Xylanimonas oleitrophica]|uniref:Vitamin K epoxide reductase n=1 Tax=Xylanimonas oleitrophica TaxID=2607479 RepID=A0A2W5WQP6_9MICO|nr:vitamin K epoxide reductase family protein [Xylanimonas oleitrophica]PZR53637.1 vitamin K epoxide reductase [Xylanimonas oleitrophica]
MTTAAPARDAVDPALEGVRPLGDRTLAVWLLVLGAVGFAASFTLSVERYLSLVEPGHVASCSLNVFVDCGAAMGSWQGRLLGFPNPYLGVAAFAVVVTTAVLWLTGYRPPRWYRLALLTGTVLGELLVVFLMYTSFHQLVSLCLYCMAVWVVMWPLLWLQVEHALQTRALPAPAGLVRALVGSRVIVLVVGYAVPTGWLLLTMGPYLVRSF